MALNIKDDATQRLAAELAEVTGETKTAAVKAALEERRARLARDVGARDRHDRLRRVLTEEIWPQLPAGVRGRPVSREERERFLGYGPEGV